jgi:hypothetical protein
MNGWGEAKQRSKEAKKQRSKEAAKQKKKDLNYFNLLTLIIKRH